MRTVPSDLLAHIQGEVTSLATCWEIIRRDGVIIRMTDHDVDLRVNNATFSAETGYDRSAIQSEMGLRPDNLNIKGFFDNAAITREDIDNGLYDYAQLRIFIVNHQDTSQGVIKLIRGTLGEVEHSPEGFFSATFQSMAEAFRSVIGDRFTSTCKEDLGSVKCSIPIQPEVRTPNKGYSLGKFVRVITDASGMDSYDLTNVGPFTGEAIMMFADMGAVDEARIDSGTAQLTTLANILQASVLNGQLGRVKVETIDADNVSTKVIYDSGFEQFFPVGTEVQRASPVTTIPPLSRGIRWTFEIDFPDAGTDASPTPDISFESISASVTTFANGYGNQSSFENLIYECTTAGVTDSATPTFGGTPGDVTTDGTAEWTTREAWTRNAVVTSVTSRTNFTIDVVEPRAVDNWFTDGVITFESGDNLGRNIEIKTWVEGGDVTLHLPLAYDLQVGDALRISPGCNKIHDNHCRLKFVIPGSVFHANGNVKNFRGEPHLPGSARMTRVTYGTRTRVREGV